MFPIITWLESLIQRTQNTNSTQTSACWKINIHNHILLLIIQHRITGNQQGLWLISSTVLPPHPEPGGEKLLLWSEVRAQTRKTPGNILELLSKVLHNKTFSPTVFGLTCRSTGGLTPELQETFSVA